MTIDPLLSLLVGALGAALIGLLGAWIQSRREHSRWVREQRLDAYRTLLQLVDRVTVHEVSAPGTLTKEDRETIAGLLEGLAAVRLVGPDLVLEAAQTMMHTAVEITDPEPDADELALQAAHDRARDSFVTSAQKELGIKA